MFIPAPSKGVFHQGEILSNVVQLHVRTSTLRDSSEEFEFEEKVHPYALVLTQDCDLDWDFKAREKQKDQDSAQENKRQAKLVPNVLLCELTTTAVLRPRVSGGDIMRRILNNQDERYHSIPPVPFEQDCTREGIPELVADFKRVFSIPTDELYCRLMLGMERRVVMCSPYIQHLGVRFGYYCSRVALPEIPTPLPPQVLLPNPSNLSSTND